ncbi:MAG: deoxyguanosinetriphosphate triphosphohydrolase family protein [Sphaerochaetaceae bacterium]
MRVFNNHISHTLLEKRQYDRQEDVRGQYYRDTTAIIHSSAFRRLKHKTQVFFAPSNDHICTRMEHVLHVASIASAICRGLHLDTELAWAIGMGHDLGHTPFGHVGETILSDMMQKKNLGKFEHELHSVRIIDFLANHGKGLNLTYAVRDGIATHNGEVFDQSLMPTFEIQQLDTMKTRKGARPATWEATVVRFSDQIAYLGRDYEDAQRLAIVEKDSLPSQVANTLGATNAQIINTLVNDLIDHSHPEKGIQFSDEIFESVLMMKEFNYSHIYRSPLLEGYSAYYARLFALIADYLQSLFETYEFDEDGYKSEKNMVAVGFMLHLTEMKDAYQSHDGNLDRVIYDYIAGMSDNFCLDCANEILTPEHLNERIEHSITGKWFDVQ